MKQISISGQENDVLCGITFDPNMLHNEAYMALVHNKKAIVAGMGVFSAAAYSYLFENIRQADINMGEFVSIGEKINVQGIDSLFSSDKTSGIWLVGHNSEKSNVLSGDGQSTFLTQLPKDYVNHRKAKTQVQFLKEFPEVFAKLIGAEHDEVSRFLYAIALSSGALQNKIKSPRTKLEKDMNSQMYAKKPKMPIYRAMSISMPEGIVQLKDEPLDFLTSLKQINKRTYVALVDCVQKDRLLYQSEFRLQQMSSKLIYKISKNK